MMPSLLFWNALPVCEMPPATIAQELMFGEEVEGLIDLPVRDVLDRLKVAFPKFDERPGVLICHGEEGPLETSWTWQMVRLQYSRLSDDDRERLLEIGREFGCEGYDA